MYGRGARRRRRRSSGAAAAEELFERVQASSGSDARQRDAAHLLLSHEQHQHQQRQRQRQRRPKAPKGRKVHPRDLQLDDVFDDSVHIASDKVEEDVFEEYKSGPQDTVEREAEQLKVEDVFNDNVVLHDKSAPAKASKPQPKHRKQPKQCSLRRQRQRNLNASRSLSQLLLDLLMQTLSSELVQVFRQLRVPAPSAPRSPPLFDASLMVGDWDVRWTPVVEYLLEGGADVDFTDRSSNFPLFLCLHYSDAEPLFECLLCFKPDVFRCWNSFSLLDVALQLRSKLSEKLLVQLQVLPCRLWDDTSPSIEDQLYSIAEADGYLEEAIPILQNAFFDAIEALDVERCRVLLEHGLEIASLHNEQHATPLLRALQCRAPLELIEFLLVHGVDPNDVDSSNTLPLQLPMLWRDADEAIKRLRLLLLYGAKPDVRVPSCVEDGVTVSLLQWAENNALHAKVVRLIEDASRQLC